MDMRWGQIDWMEIITIIITTVGMILSIISFYSNRFTMKNEYFRWATTKKMIKARHIVRSSEELSVRDKYIPEILNFYNYWGLMVRQHHLPLSIFHSASGINVIEIYEKLENIIKNERRRNELYARDFEWLYKKLKKKYKNNN